jgi:chloramphenicol 3-O phosphotransferase
LLNGASGSGTPTLARQLQDQLDQPFLYLSSDQLVDSRALPRRRDDERSLRLGSPTEAGLLQRASTAASGHGLSRNNLIVDHINKHAAGNFSSLTSWPLQRVTRQVHYHTEKL